MPSRAPSGDSSRTAGRVADLGSADRGASRPRKALTIGAVCNILGAEFPDISISKIRYLEDQGLLSPRRTSGGYRLYSQTDVERLRSILRMQRDEFLPLRVIRQELGSGQFTKAARSPRSDRGGVFTEASGEFDRDELIREAGIDESLMREFEEFRIVRASRGNSTYPISELEVVRAARVLAEHGLHGRNLRSFLTAADREASMIDQLFASTMRSASEQRRREAERSIETVVGACAELRHRLLVRELRGLTD